MGEQLDIFGDDGKRGSGQSASHETQQGVDTPGQSASLAAGNVADPHRAPAGHRSAAPSSPLSRPSIDERWAEFHAANPHVFAELLRLARARLARGEGRIGVKALWEELRSWLSVTGQDVYKLNNDYTSLYARALIERDPALASLIEVRRRKTDD